MTEVRWERMFPDQLEAALAACPVVYFPYGLCEPHGPQNAVGLDALKAHAICCRTAQGHGGIVAPPDYWHIHEIGLYASWAAASVGEARSWLTAVPPWIHFKNICYHLRAADALGFHAAILLTGHYGPNWEDLKTLLGILQPHFAMRLYGLPDFEANQPGFDNDGKATGDHAGKVETSLLWALEPACVDVSRLPAPDEPGHHFAMGKNAHESNRLVGERMVADEVRWLGAKAAELLADYQTNQPAARQPLTFMALEQIWANEVMPQLTEFKTMQYLERTPPPADSTWQLNYRIPTVNEL
ncbi:MAG TPA: creatininase family protein [Caldilineaceae bacterium]|nr:creatininase family protein [Caldilineaceae bacterium]